MPLAKNRNPNETLLRTAIAKIYKKQTFQTIKFEASSAPNKLYCVCSKPQELFMNSQWYRLAGRMTAWMTGWIAG